MKQVVSSVKALIFHHNKFLLLKEQLKDGIVWDLPGGKIEYGESPQEALKREVKEEIYVDVEVGKSVGVWWFLAQRDRGQIICHTFLCTPPNNFKIDFNHNPAAEEMIGYEWLTKEDFLSKEFKGLNPSLKELVASL